MKAFEFRPFVKEDFPEAPWMEKLIRPLNSVLGQLRAGLDRSLSLGDNLNAEIKTLDTSTFPVKFQTRVRGKTIGVLVFSAYEVSGRSLTAVSGIGGVGWDQDGSTIILRGVTGCNPGMTYRLTLAVIGA